MVKFNIFLLGAAALPPDDGGDKETWVIVLKDKRRKEKDHWTQWKRTKNIEGKIEHKGLYVGTNVDISAYDRQILFGSIKIGRIHEVQKLLDSLEPGDMSAADYLIHVWKKTLDEEFFEEAYDVDVEEGIKSIREVVPAKADYIINFFLNDGKPTVQWDNLRFRVVSLVEKKNKGDVASLRIC